MPQVFTSVLCAALWFAGVAGAATPDSTPVLLAQAAGAGTPAPGAAPVQGAGVPAPAQRGNATAGGNRTPAPPAGTAPPLDGTISESPGTTNPGVANPAPMEPVPSAGVPLPGTNPPNGNGVTVGDPSAPNGMGGSLDRPDETNAPPAPRRPQATGPTTINPPPGTGARTQRTPQEIEREFAEDIRSCAGLPPGERTACRGEAERRRRNM